MVVTAPKHLINIYIISSFTRKKLSWRKVSIIYIVKRKSWRSSDERNVAFFPATELPQSKLDPDAMVFLPGEVFLYLGRNIQKFPVQLDSLLGVWVAEAIAFAK